MCAKLLQSCQLFPTLWTVAHQSPLFLGFSRQEYWSGLPCPPPGNLPNPGIELCLLRLQHWQAGSSTWEAQVFIRRNKKRVQYLWIDTQLSSERESCPCGSLDHFYYGAFLSDFLWPVLLLCLVLILYLVYLRILPGVHAYLLAKMESTEEAYG